MSNNLHLRKWMQISKKNILLSRKMLLFVPYLQCHTYVDCIKVCEHCKCKAVQILCLDETYEPSDNSSSMQSYTQPPTASRSVSQTTCQHRFYIWRSKYGASIRLLYHESAVRWSYMVVIWLPFSACHALTLWGFHLDELEFLTHFVLFPSAILRTSCLEMCYETEAFYGACVNSP